MLTLLSSGVAWGQSTANYAFANATNGSLTLDRNGNAVDMSTGTTQLQTATGTTDAASAVTSLPTGFQFVFMGVPYTQFSVNNNGLMRLGSTVVSTEYSNNLNTTADMPQLTAFWEDLNSSTTTGTTKTHYKVVGSAPNRTLVVEWKDAIIRYNVSTSGGGSTWQVRLYESTGIIEYVYGTMTVSGTPSSAVTASIGFSTAAADNKVLSVTSISSPAVTRATASVNNSLVNSTATGAIAGLNSAADGSRVVYTFTPPQTVAAPTTLAFTNATPISHTVNFTDASTSEYGFAIYRSTDNVTFTLLGTVASTTTAGTGTSYSYNDSGLSASTTYYYRVVSYNEGAVSPNLSGSQTTPNPVPLCGTYTVGPTGNYPSLTNAFNQLVGNGVSCAVVLELQSTYLSSVETFPLAYTFTGGSATNTVTVRPAAGASTLSISSNAAYTFNINGGKYLILDGRPGGSGATVSGAATATDLIIANTSTSGIPLNLAGDAQNNAVQHCQVKGVGSSTSYPDVSFSSTATSAGGGNSNNLIQYNNMGDGATAPAVLVYSGSSSNASNTVANNNLFNFYYGSGSSYGVYLSSAGAGWTISSNSLYQTGTRTAVGQTHYGIYVVSGGGHTIANNAIGGNAAATVSTSGPATLSGTWTASTTSAAYRFVGIYLNGASTATTLQNNTIGNFSWYSSSGSSTSGGVWAGLYVLSNANVQGNTIGNNVTVTGTTTGSMSYGIVSSTGPTTLNVSGNTVAGLSGAGSTASIAVSVTGIQTNGTTNNVFQNKVYGLSAANAGTVYGINALAGTTTTVYNNLIGNLSAAASTVSPAVVGLYVGGGTTVNAYYNSINLGGTSSGSGFGAAGVYASTTPTLTLTNNLVVNAATPTGAGVSAAYRRSSTTLTSYSAASNNNLFYTIAAPTTAQPLYYDGTNTYATLAAYKTAMNTRDQSSVTENPPFVSTTGSDATYLHISASTATQVESGGIPVSGITTDYDGTTRNASTPDIGADEGSFTPSDLTPPVIAYTPLANTSSLNNRTVTAVITDASGVATGAGAPRIYYKLSSAGTYFSDVATSVAGNAYTFTIDYANIGGAPAAGATIQYYIAAQDVATATNVGTSPAGGSGATPPGSTAPTTPNSYQLLQALAGDYYIMGTAAAGTSPGGAAREYATLTAAAADYNAKGLSGPVRFWLFSSTQGTETYPINFGANPDASSTNTLTIKPYSGVTATFTNTTSTATFKTTSGSYIILDGSNTSGGTTRDLTLSNTSTSATAAALVWVASTTAAPSSGVQVLNLNLQGAANGGSNTSAGVMVSSTTYNQSTGGSATGTVIRNNAIQGTSFGIVEGNDATAPGTVQIVNNLLGPATAATATNLNVYGIYVNNVASPVITGNTVRNVVNTTYAYGIYLGASSGGVVDANKINGVTSSSTGGYGGIGIYVAPATANANTRVSNNFVSGLSGTSYTGLTSGAIVGILVNGTTAQSGISLYHNSVYLSGSYTPGSTSSGLITAALGVTSGNTGLDVRNNVLANTLASSSGTSKSYALYSSVAASAYTSINYNDYYVGGTQGMLAYLGGDLANLAALQGATGQDANSKNLDPQFTSTSDLHTTNAGLAAGTPISGITTDIDGETRNATAPYLGADEFVPVAVDAQPTALVAPATSTTCYSSAETVTVTVKNASTTTALDFAATPVTVTVTVSGAATQTFTQTYSDNSANVGNPLAVGATVNLTLPGTLNMSTAGTYTFAVTATAQGDQKPLNDNLASQTRTVTAPALTSISASTTGICGASGSVTLTATGVVGGTVTWYSSADGYAAAIGTGTPLTQTLSATTSFRANVVCGSNTSANSNVVAVTVTNPVITSTNASPGSICGNGTSTITAGAASGTTIRLYDAATGGNLLATGTTGAGTISYTTPAISTTTTYYAEANQAGGIESVGRSAPTIIGSPGLTGYGLTFDATESFVLKSVDVYNTGAATNLTLEVQNSSGTVISGLTATVAIPAGTGTTAFTIPLNFTVPAGTGMKIIGQTGSSALVRETGISSFPYISPNGIVKVTGGATGAATNYYFFYNWQVNSQCAGSRTAIPVTVTPATALTPASTTQTVCAGSSTTITFSGYPSLSVTPTAGTVVNGQDITFTPPLGTTTYTVTGTDGTCSNTATVALTSTALSAGTATVTSAPFCNGSGGTPALKVSNLTGQTDFVWQQSTTGTAGSFTTIAGSDNQTTFTAPAITATTYYQVLATCGSNTATSSVLAVAVGSPSVASTNSPATRCGAGTVPLTAIGSAGTTAYYYAAATGGQPLGSGSSYAATVTATPATQTFYVAARDNSGTTYVAGLVDNTGSLGTYVAAGGSNRTLGFDVSQAGTLASVDVYPSAAGSVNILVYAAAANPGATGTLLATVASPVFTAAQVGTRVTVPMNVALVPGSYKLSSSTLSRYTSFTGTYPYTTGPLTILGSYNSATATTYTAATYNSFFNVTFAASCESARTAIDVNVTTPPTLAYTGSTAICSGNSTVLTFTPASYTALTVNPTTGAVVDNVAHTITFSPAASTSYTVTGTDGNTATGCSSTVAVSITVNPAPSAPILSSTAASICTGNSTTVTASQGATGTTILATATFDNGLDGFTLATSGAATAGTGFGRQTAPYTPSPTYSGGPSAYNGPSGASTGGFIIANSGAGGSGSTTNTQLTSPAFSTVGYTTATVSFQQYYKYWSSGDVTTKVEYTTNGGSTWATLVDYKTASASDGTGSGAETPKSIALPAAALGQSAVQIRFNYQSGWGYYWALDNVGVTGTPQIVTYAVSPSTGATVSGSTITFNPSSTTTYQVTASFATGCQSPATPVTITVNTATVWTGAVDTDWFASGNWTNCVPSRYTDATIPAGAPNYPSLSTATLAEVKSLTLDAGSSLSQNAGTLNVYGNLTDNTPGVSLAGGTVSFVGTDAQQLNAASTFFNLTVDKASDTLRVTANPTVTGALTMSNGIVKTYTPSVTNQINLSGTLAETASSFVLGNVVTSATLGTDGASSAFGGLGLTLTAHTTGGASLPGATTVTRMTGRPMYGMAGSTSIRRQFNIQPATDTNLNVDMVFGYGDSAFELQGIGETSLTLFSNAGVPGGWRGEGYTSRDDAANTVTLNGLNHLSLWTLGSEAAPLPVSLTTFTAQRQGADAVLAWTTAQEKNNRGFEVQVSLDGRTFRPLGFVAAETPNSTSARHYRFVDREAGKQGLRYYRLRQLDLDGTAALFGPRTVQFEQVTKLAVAAFPNPFAGQELTLDVVSPAAGATELVLLDAVGRVVLRQTVTLQAGAQRLPLRLTETLPVGAYLLRLTSAGQTGTVRVVKQ